MCLIRAFEERVGELARAGEVRGVGGLSLGREAVAAGVCRQLSDDDFVYAGPRPHGHALATGASLEATMAELMGRAGGLCKGLGGSAHLVNVEHGLMAGGNVAMAVGSALAARLRSEDQVAVAFFDEQALRAGHVTEALNLATLWELPVIFVCESDERAAGDAVAGHDVAESVDGGDAVSVWEAFAPFLAYARAGRGPLLLECVVGA
jgi:acetoin:2,6-dichlorophenolindophenol oxidoreductase subunit alpha